MELRQNSRNGLFLSLNGLNGVLKRCPGKPPSLYKDRSGTLNSQELFAFSRESGRLLGLSPKLQHHEGIFFDPEALAEPVRMTRTLERSPGFEEGDPYTFIECVQTIDALEVATSVRDPSLARNGRWKSGVL
jgi:hypothetical protein